MLRDLVTRFNERQDVLKTKLTKHPEGYKALVKAVIEVIANGDDDGPALDPERIHEIDDGDYQGTLVYVIAEEGYQPHDYWYVKVGYGSCSGCDTLQDIRDYDYHGTPNEQQVKDYMTLALHIIQGIKKMGDE